MNVLLQRFRRPLAETGGFFGVHAVTHGDDGVKIVKIYRPFYLPLTLLPNCFHFGNSCITGKLLLFIDILQVL